VFDEALFPYYPGWGRIEKKLDNTWERRMHGRSEKEKIKDLNIKAHLNHKCNELGALFYHVYLNSKYREGGGSKTIREIKSEVTHPCSIDTMWAELHKSEDREEWERTPEDKEKIREGTYLKGLSQLQYNVWTSVIKEGEWTGEVEEQRRL
jgi:hypothetical protein